MKFITYNDLRELIDMESLELDLLAEGLRLASAGNSRKAHIWSFTDTFETDCLDHAIKHGWDPEKALVLWRPPPTSEERAEAAERTRKAIEEDPDWDDIQIGNIPEDQVTATMYPDMTKERLAEIIMKSTKLKAFL